MFYLQSHWDFQFFSQLRDPFPVTGMLKITMVPLSASPLQLRRPQDSVAGGMRFRLRLKGTPIRAGTFKQTDHMYQLYVESPSQPCNKEIYIHIYIWRSFIIEETLIRRFRGLNFVTDTFSHWIRLGIVSSEF